MTTVRSLCTDSPHATMETDELAALLASLAPADARTDWRDVVAAGGVHRRSTVARGAALARLGTLADRTARYAALAVPAAERVARAALARAGIAPEAVGVLVTASSTGHMLPTLDCALATRLGLPAATQRLALDGLGCAGALRGIAHAARLIDGASGAALVVAVELPSLWLPSEEPSRADLEAAATFGDGAGAVVLAPGHDGGGPRLLASRSVLWPDSLGERGALLTSAGLRHRQSPALARRVRAELPATVAAFLADHALTLAAIDFVALNPRALRLTTSLAAELALPAGTGELARAVWTEHGNTLAVGPLHVLRLLAERTPPATGSTGLVIALGPGITCDLLLLRWDAPLATAHHTDGEMH